MASCQCQTITRYRVFSTRALSFFLFEDKKIVLTEERIQVSRHPLCCPTCGEMSQRENLPSSAHSALPGVHLFSYSSSSSSLPTADGAFDEIIKILNFPNSPGLAREALVGVLNNEDYQMRRDHFER